MTITAIILGEDLEVLDLNRTGNFFPDEYKKAPKNSMNQLSTRSAGKTNFFYTAKTCASHKTPVEVRTGLCDRTFAAAQMFLSRSESQLEARRSRMVCKVASRVAQNHG